MRNIHLADDLRLRFPARENEFIEGFKTGMLAALMSLGQADITRRISAESLEQISALAVKLGYYLAKEVRGENWVDVTLSSGRAKPKLQLVFSRDKSPVLEAAVG